MLNIGNKIFRNMQEQVAYNSKCIQAIKDYLDGLEISDSLIVLTSSSGSLTAEEMAVVEKKVAFIYLNGELYVKSEDIVPSSYIFRQVKLKATEVGSAYYEIGGSKIVVTIGTATYAQSDEVVIVAYSKSQIDSIVANIMTIKANVADVYSKTQADLLLAGKADLAGANFTGAITAPSIIENMSGYSFSASSPSNLTIENIFCSVVKNGNKLTIVQFGKITRTDSISYADLGTFFLPADVASKLYPTPLGVVSGALSSKVISFFDTPQSCVDLKTIVRKGTNSVITTAYGLGSLVANTEYQFRIETTFLLSENLAS